MADVLTFPARLRAAAVRRVEALEAIGPQLDALRGLILREEALATVLRALERQKTRAALRIMQGRWQTNQHGPDPENPDGDLIRRPDLYGFCGLAGSPQ